MGLFLIRSYRYYQENTLAAAGVLSVEFCRQIPYKVERIPAANGHP
jgi:hypothetical protein